MTDQHAHSIINDLDAIRPQVERYTGFAGSSQSFLAHQLAKRVPALVAEVEQLRKVETAALHMLVLAPDEYRQAIVAARASMSGDDYAKNNGRAEMIRVFATGLAERAGLPPIDWEQIKRDVPADGVYRTGVKA